jgi:hypothetical protein
MEASKNHGNGPAGKDLGLMLFLVAACPFGLLSWVALFSAIHWSVLAVWGAAVGILPHTASIAITPAIAAQAPAHPASSSLWILPHGLHSGPPG